MTCPELHLSVGKTGNQDVIGSDAADNVLISGYLSE
jgi:hypothetical protein